MNYETYQKANEIAEAVKTAELVLELFSKEKSIFVQSVTNPIVSHEKVSGRLFADLESFLRNEIEILSKEFNEL